MKFEAGKEYRTRDGGRARVYAVDGGGVFPIHGAVWYEEDGWIDSTWEEDGSCLQGVDQPIDLMPPKQTSKRYLFQYEDGTVGMSSEPRLYRDGVKVIATQEVYLEEGEFGFDLPTR